ncbi:MAG TPA: HAD-IB family hydrolase [Candidatus Acidoferrum sp.]|jgi:HAD superfamily hydrolase (TIGR01490 family)
MAGAPRAESIAAFFDLDGTLLPSPSLERRFFALLRYRQAIGGENYLRWLAKAAALAPKGIAAVIHSNKAYLRDVEARHAEKLGREFFPDFFDAALQRIAWHVGCGHTIVLVSGTPQPLAHKAARRLAEQLREQGISASIKVCATVLEENGGRWTGKIVGEAMFGKGKARAVRLVSKERGFKLAECFAYGDSIHDRWLLQEVGRPNAVNPSPDLLRMARRESWPTLFWKNKGRWKNERVSERTTAGTGLATVASVENRNEL